MIRALLEYITKRSSHVASSWRSTHPDAPTSSSYDEQDRTCINLLRAFIYHFRETENSEYAFESLPGVKTRVKHSEVLEGLLFLLLDRAGMLLYNLIFAEDGSLETAAAARHEAHLLMPLYRILLPVQVHCEFDLPEEANNRPPGEPLTKKLKTLNPSDEYAQVMKGAKQMNNRRTLTAKLKGTPASRSLLGQKHSLSKVPLNKIQNTLLRGMFGKRQEENGGLSEMCIRDPLELGTNTMSETDDEMDLDAGMTVRSQPTSSGSNVGQGGESFVMEMWYRVGWDVLANGFSTGRSP